MADGSHKSDFIFLNLEENMVPSSNFDVKRIYSFRGPKTRPFKMFTLYQTNTFDNVIPLKIFYL